MTFDRPPSANPPASADPPKRVLVVALIVMVVLAALAATALVLVLLGRESPSAGVDPSPTPTEQPTQSPEPTPSPTPDPTPSPSPEPTPQTEPTDGLTHLDYGARATVAVDRLRVRYQPSTEYDVATVITAGQEILILSGPITAEDYEWYLVELPNPEDEDEVTMGWVAAVPAGADGQADAWLIRIGPLNCPPEAVDTPMLARMTEYAITQCDVQVSAVQGLVDSCYQDGYTPFYFKPDWAGYSCWFLRDRKSTWRLQVFFPPEMERQVPERGDIVTLSGGLGIEADTYGPCTVTTSGYDIPEEQLATQQEIFEARCRTKFVVTAVSVEGHITMPPPGYY